MVIQPGAGGQESWRRWERGVLGASRPEATDDRPGTEDGGTDADQPASEPQESIEDLLRWTAAAASRVRYR